MPLIIFVLFLSVPLLNVKFTFYPTSIKVFAFQTAVTVLWCFLGVQWAGGRLRLAAWPAWWLFVPVVLWVGWGALTALWSAQSALAAGWVVRGVYGAAGALGLASRVRERVARKLFVAAASAVAFVLALFMVFLYGPGEASFLGDRGLVGRDVGAAFLLVPTLVAAAVLYGRGGEEERDYRLVLWTVLLLAVLLWAGVQPEKAARRAGGVAWLYGVAVGVGLLVWVVLPRWRMAAPLLVALAVLVGVTHREPPRPQMEVGRVDQRSFARVARIDKASWGLVRSGATGQLLAGRGVGTFMVAFDLHRPLETYASRGGAAPIGHAPRQVVEVLFERGIVGLLLALAVGGACVAAGVVALRRASETLDSSLGAGLAAGVVAMGHYACFSNGAVSFGAGMVFWLAVGLLGALTVECGRDAGLALSPEEGAWRNERRPATGPGRSVFALGGCAVAVVAWIVVGVRPFWAEYCLVQGIQEKEAAEPLMVRWKRLLNSDRLFSPNELRYMRLRREAELGNPESEGQAEQLKAKLPVRTVERCEGHRADIKETKARLLTATAAIDDYFGRAARWSLGDRVWLASQYNRLRFAIDFGKRETVAEIEAQLEALCGGFMDLDVYRGEYHLEVYLQGKDAGGDDARELELAHRLLHRYAQRNPFAAVCALRYAKTDVYHKWVEVIGQARRAKHPGADAWASAFLAATEAGLRIDPRRYMLAAWRGKMLFHLGRLEESEYEMRRATDLVEERLMEDMEAPRPFLHPMVRIKLYIDGAETCLLWDHDRALDLLGEIPPYAAARRVDLVSPAYAGVRQRVEEILQRIFPELPPAGLRRGQSRPAEAGGP